MTTRASFKVSDSSAHETGSTLVVGQSHLGMAAVTAADYLVRQLDSTDVGHVTPRTLPAIAPFEDGVPRHHSRLFTLDGTELTVLVGEMFVPVGAAREFATALLEWVDDNGIEEILLLHGVPFPHGPDEHAVFHVATPDYYEERLSDEPFPPLKGGFLDGVVGELVTRGLDDGTLATGVFLTPTHPPGPDVDAALLLIEAIETVYGIHVDETELRELGEQLNQYYAGLADRLVALADADESLAGHDYPVDRMYM
jgi:uncharacterized protein